MTEAAGEEGGGDELVGQVEEGDEGGGEDEEGQHAAVDEPEAGDGGRRTVEQQKQGQGEGGDEVPVPVAVEHLGGERHVDHQGEDQSLRWEEDDVVDACEALPAQPPFGSGDEQGDDKQGAKDDGWRQRR